MLKGQNTGCREQGKTVIESMRHRAACIERHARKNLSDDFLFLGKIDLYSLARHCRICRREVFSKVSRGFRRLLEAD